MKHFIEFAVLLYSLISTTGFLTTPSFQKKLQGTRLFSSSTTTTPYYAKEAESLQDANNRPLLQRKLGSQELLMLPRQYMNSTFPPMCHVCAVQLSHTPSLGELHKAVEVVMSSHPLLRSVIQGKGEPAKRIDLFQMVREGEPDPCTFMETPPGQIRAEDLVTVVEAADLEKSWKEAFEYHLDRGIEASDKLPLWRLEMHTSKKEECALIFKFNHAISDQSSVHVMIDHLLSTLSALEDKTEPPRVPIEQQTIPPSLEESMLGSNAFGSKGYKTMADTGTLKYVAGKAAEGFKNPVTLPDNIRDGSNAAVNALTTISGRAAGGEDAEEGAPGCAGRSSTVEFLSLPSSLTTNLIQRCRENGITLTHALSAAMALTSSQFISPNPSSNKKRWYKVLQSMDMRRFESTPDTCETPSCHAGSMDIMYGPISDHASDEKFWELAKEGSKQTKEFIESSGPAHAVKVFDFAMTISDMNNLVHLTAMSKSSQGRAYSAGIVNAGVYERQKGILKEGSQERENLKLSHGKYTIEDIYFATSHARSGCLYQLSTVTLDNEMKLTFHPASPLVPKETNAEFAKEFVQLLERVASPEKQEEDVMSKANGILSQVSSSLPLLTALGGIGLNAIHLPAWTNFFSSVNSMAQTMGYSPDFWAALKFWIFFAVGHPILQPILFLSDVLHGSPGPMVGDLVPAGFLLWNVVFLSLFALSKEIRTAVNIAAVSLFFAYIGAGLDGKVGLGDYNLALNDNYQGKVVKGCPAYDEVRQPSMNNFDLEKYQGKWYEQKFHDWTQFKEVYDTTLDIQLTPDGKGWKDDFAVKGPAPKAAKLSWDKSPVANGAHYFLFGRVDDRDPPGVLRESGFGVEFPNYIVDVQTDPKTGEYTEAIQFQCLERGGVRVFEGINFLSRKPEMTDAELTAMHARAAQAGMNPYGAGVEQMHVVERRDVEAPPLDNAWQAMWRNVGLDKLLELLTESIEDGGR